MILAARLQRFDNYTSASQSRTMCILTDCNMWNWGFPVKRPTFCRWFLKWPCPIIIHITWLSCSLPKLSKGCVKTLLGPLTRCLPNSCLRKCCPSFLCFFLVLIKIKLVTSEQLVRNTDWWGIKHDFLGLLLSFVSPTWWPRRSTFSFHSNP